MRPHCARWCDRSRRSWWRTGPARGATVSLLPCSPCRPATGATHRMGRLARRSRCQLPARPRTGRPRQVASGVYGRACERLCVPVAVCGHSHAWAGGAGTDTQRAIPGSDLFRVRVLTGQALNIKWITERHRLRAPVHSCFSRASSLPGGKSNEDIDRLHASRTRGRDHGNYLLRQRWRHHYHYCGDQHSSHCSQVVYGPERLPLRSRGSQRRVLP